MATVQYAAREAGDSKTVGWAGQATDRQGAMQTLAHDGLGRFVVVPSSSA